MFKCSEQKPLSSNFSTLAVLCINPVMYTYFLIENITHDRGHRDNCVWWQGPGWWHSGLVRGKSIPTLSLHKVWVPTFASCSEPLSRLCRFRRLVPNQIEPVGIAQPGKTRITFAFLDMGNELLKRLSFQIQPCWHIEKKNKLSTGFIRYKWSFFQVCFVWWLRQVCADCLEIQYEIWSKRLNTHEWLHINYNFT